MAGKTDAGDVARQATRVFISYSRKDIDAAENLRQRLIDAGLDAFLDRHDIVKGEPWRDRLRGLIEGADVIVFMISPDSVASEICAWEVNEAELRAKRVFPVVARDVEDALIPQRLQRLNYTFLNKPDAVAEEFPKLIGAIAEDASWVREHTRLGEIALRWERAAKPNRLLLRGKDLKDAEAWRDARTPAGPELSPLHVAYISESRRGQARRLFTGAASLLGVGAIAVAAIALVAILEANLRSSQLAESRSLAAASRTQVARGEAELGVLLALEGLPGAASGLARPHSPDAEAALAFALAAYRDTAVVAAPQGRITAAAPAAPGEVLAGSDAGRLWTLDAVTGAKRRVLIEQGPAVTRLAASPQGAYAVALADKQLLLWPAGVDAPVALAPHPATVVSLAFGANGATLAIQSATDYETDGDAEGRVELLSLAAPDAPLFSRDGLYALSLSPSGDLAAIGERDMPVAVHRMSDGSTVDGLFGPGSYSGDPHALSDDGRWLAFGDWQGTGVVTDMTTHEAAPMGEGLGFRTNMNSAISGDGLWAAFSARSGAVEVWRRDRFGMKDEGNPDSAADRTFANDGFLEFKTSFDQQDTANLAFSPAGARLALGLAGGEAALIDGLASFDSYGSGELASAQIKPARMDTPPLVSFLGEDRVMLVSEKIALVGFAPALAGLQRLPPPPPADDDLADITELYTAMPENAGWTLVSEGRLGEHPEWTEGGGLRAEVSENGDVLVSRAGSDTRLSRIDTQGKGVSAMAILPGGREIAVGLSNRRLLVADTQSGAVLRDFPTGMSPATTLYIDGQTKRLIVFTFESQFHDGAFSLPLDFPRCEALTGSARALMRRELTADERRLFADAAEARPPLLSAYLAARQAVMGWVPAGDAGCR
jgi:hypothetical protein